ncbi:unnamed protein product [Sphagnum balticum]
MLRRYPFGLSEDLRRTQEVREAGVPNSLPTTRSYRGGLCRAGGIVCGAQTPIEGADRHAQARQQHVIERSEEGIAARQERLYPHHSTRVLQLP